MVILLTGFIACQRKYTPKPDGYFRIDPYPELFQQVTLEGSTGNLAFEIPQGTETSLRNDSTLQQVQWFNVRFPRYRATLYCSYHPLRDNLDRLMAESRELVYRQSIRPEAVTAGTYEDSERAIYATLYNLSAESATPLQFVVTDSTHYLLRGALYFDEPGKSDSIAPVINHLSDHIIHLIESIETSTR